MKSPINVDILLLVSLIPTSILSLTPPDPNGANSCPCIDPWDSSNAHLLCRTLNKNGDCYTVDFGADSCQTFDKIENTTGCAKSDGNQKPDWCQRRWCYVDPENCQKPNSASSFFGQKSNNTQYYSYETCGNLNSYDDSAITQTFGKYSGVNDGELRVTFPGDDTLGVITYDTITPVYGFHSSFADFGKKGHGMFQRFNSCVYPSQSRGRQEDRGT